MNARKLIIQALSKSSREFRVSKYKSFSEVYGENVFCEKVQKERLPHEVFQALQKTIKEGVELTCSIADPIAQAMREWAMEKGATHFCHWFQPLTDLTAEKHDSFFSYGLESAALSSFTANELVRGEPNPNSFPLGNVRSNFEARGYTTWDPKSPAFLLNNGSATVLVIPTKFLSWLGEALDKKTPLLRSMEVLSKHALRILKLFGDHETKNVYPMVGAEQEYFLIDKHFYHLRPDLVICTRTLFGASFTKGDTEDHCLGAIPERVLAVMHDVEYELARLGIPAKTRHNEVAPSQYEIALIHQVANLAADHHMILMDLLKKVADRHGMSCVLHEKPFAGMNGSGKHNNWSLAKETGENLFEAGSTSFSNAQFLIFCAAVVRAVHKYAPLLSMSIASAGNDLRLGHYEAPPAIISVFLGEQLSEIFKNLAEEERKEKIFSHPEVETGADRLSFIPRHCGDQNRTSPFAFTGNKFEFRSLGASANIAEINTTLNTIVAESLDFFASQLEEKIRNGEILEKAVHTMLSECINEVQPILFEGDNYHASWKEEAEKRGLPHLTNAVEAITMMTSNESIVLFTKYKVYSLRELECRQETALRKYIKTINAEAKTASMITHTMILPACYACVREIGEALAFLRNGQTGILKPISQELHAIRKILKSLDDALEKKPEDNILELAEYMRDKVQPLMVGLRQHVDALEKIADDNHWPLPKYHEMLFIR